jgi:molybdopterin biosynthesis enzyme
VIFLDVLGYILARDIIAKEPYPPFAASIKDGYAVVGNTVFKITPVHIWSLFSSSLYLL